MIRISAIALLGLICSATAFAQKGYSPCNRTLTAMDGRYGFTDSDGTTVIEPRYDLAYPFMEQFGAAMVRLGGEAFAIDTLGRRIEARVRLPRFRDGGPESYTDYIRERIRFRSTHEWKRMRSERVRAVVFVNDKGRSVECRILESSSAEAAHKVEFAALHAPYWTTPSIDYEQQGFAVPLDMDFSTLAINLTTFYPIDENRERIDSDFISPSFRGGDIYEFLKWTNTKKYIKNRDDYYRADNDAVRVTFVIDEKGRLRDPMVISCKNEICRDKALEILSKSPRWKPATIDGRAVPCRYDSVYINFRFHR